MSASSAQDEALVDEERRSPPVTLSEVLAACRELEMSGVPITRRSVRDKLGRGSMTTIHNGVTQYESRRDPPAPAIDLTQEDRNVIAELGARALAIAEGRVERVLAERETVLHTQVIAANARADDAIAAAEAMVSEAQRHALSALAISETARSERDSALAAAEEDRQRALRLEGQIELLGAGKIEAEERIAKLDADLATTKAELAVERALRQRREVESEELRAAQASLQTQIAEQAKESESSLARTREALAAEQGRLAELTSQRVRSIETIQHLETELSRRAEELSKSTAALAVAEATVATRDETIREISLDLSAERIAVKQLMGIVTANDQHADVLRSLETSIASLASRVTSASRD